MTERQDKFSLTVNGQVIDTVDGTDVNLSMIEPGSPWTFSLWWSEDRRSTWEILQQAALEGAGMSVSLSGAIQLTGVIEYRQDSGGREGGTMVISGRDTAGVLMDADADPRIMARGLTLGDLFDKYLEPYGLQAHLLEGSDAVQMRSRPRALHIPEGRTRRHRARRVNLVDGWRAKPGQTLWQLLDEACRRSGFMLWTAPWPRQTPPGIGLVVDAPKEAGTSIYGFTRIKKPNGTYGGNILSATHTINGRRVPTEVTAFANNQLIAQQDARLRATVTNEARKDRWSFPNPFPRPRFMHANEVHGIASARRVAEREIARANSMRRVYECTVRGFASILEPDAPFYTIDEFAYVRDDFHGIDETMLITDVHFHQSRKNGDLTTLKMVPRGALRVFPEV